MFRKFKRENRKREKKDCCVSCGAETEYSKETHVNLRKYYVEGAGQLCEKCYRRIMKGGQGETSN